MAKYVIEATARSAASPEQVFALLADGRSWLGWGVWTGYVLESPGADAPEGPGAVRALTSRALWRTVVSRERILEVLPGRRVSYELLSGLPLRAYRGQVDVAPDGGGTVIRWRSGFDGAPFGSGRFYRAVLQRFIEDAARRLAQYAERSTAT